MVRSRYVNKNFPRNSKNGLYCRSRFFKVEFLTNLYKIKKVQSLLLHKKIENEFRELKTTSDGYPFGSQY